MPQESTLHNLIETIFEISRKYEDAPGWAMALKVGEEVGEFQEAVMKEYGYLKHKELKEGTWTEAGDIIIALIGFFAMHNPDLTAEELFENLSEAISAKKDKYLTVLGVKDE